ncbi:MAG: STAS domain-containing protein [Candidatus Muirbacterium halophilum]|nr:STAS domain-containing protein [Candidatus Muirbacterium halophilum]MCK9475043.1 STAS domain-containing protein [Candidatus Muirbacterium halophilum]
MEINFKHIEEENIVIVFPSGSFEMEDSAYFEKTVSDIISETKTKKLLLNMSMLEYLNSTALNLFIGVYNRLLKSGIRIVFCSLSKPVETLFNITSLKLLVPIYPTEWDAIQYLKK